MWTTSPNSRDDASGTSRATIGRIRGDRTNWDNLGARRRAAAHQDTARMAPCSTTRWTSATRTATSLGAMILDANDPTKILYRSRVPVLEPEEWYENTGWKSGVVYSCGAVVKDGELYVYYGGADSVVCVAVGEPRSLFGRARSHGTPRLTKKSKLKGYRIAYSPCSKENDRPKIQSYCPTSAPRGNRKRSIIRRRLFVRGMVHLLYRATGKATRASRRSLRSALPPARTASISTIADSLSRRNIHGNNSVARIRA